MMVLLRRPLSNEQESHAGIRKTKTDMEMEMVDGLMKSNGAEDETRREEEVGRAGGGGIRDAWDDDGTFIAEKSQTRT